MARGNEDFRRLAVSWARNLNYEFVQGGRDRWGGRHMEKGETWERVQLSEESPGLFSQLNVEIEKQGGVENNLIVQGHSTHLSVTLFREALWIRHVNGPERFLGSSYSHPQLFPGAQSPLESSRSFKAHVLIIFFLLIFIKSDLWPFPLDICAPVRDLHRARSTITHSNIKGQHLFSTNYFTFIIFIWRTF